MEADMQTLHTIILQISKAEIKKLNAYFFIENDGRRFFLKEFH